MFFRYTFLLYFGINTIMTSALYIGFKKYPKAQRSLLPLVLSYASGLYFTYHFQYFWTQGTDWFGNIYITEADL